DECVIDYATTTRRVDRRAVPRPTTKRAPKWQKPAFIGAGLALLLVAGAFGWRQWGRPGAASAADTGQLEAKRVAVLYFEDVSPGAKLAYLADGLTESLIDCLQEIDALDVVSKDGVSKFRGTDVNADSIAQEFSAGTIVRGTVEEQGEQVHVSVRLVDGNSGTDIKRQSFDQPKGDVFAVRDTIVSRVANFLRERIGDEVRLRDARSGTSNVAAWTAMQRGAKLRRDAVLQAAKGDTIASAQNFIRADSLLAQAETLDPRWVDPVTERSRVALARASAVRGAVQAKPFLQQGITHANRALTINPRHSPSLTARGLSLYRQWALALYTTPTEAKGLLDRSANDLKAAVEIDKTNAEAWSQLSQIRNAQDDLTGAKLAALRAYEEDAYLQGTDRVLWRLYTSSYDLEEFPDALKYCETGGARFPENPLFVRCRLWLFTTNSRPADPAEAWKDYEKLKALTPKAAWEYQGREAAILVAAALARANQQDSARALLLATRVSPALTATVDPEGSLITIEAFVRTLFNTSQDTDEAFKLMRKYLSSNPAHRTNFRESQSWWWNALKADPRFPGLVSGAG
ncbi:MAG TPA: hypothetical protein VM939_10750, partial [Gemmatimonadaceae bacterium]|nr:hypothetical protein [Gemmatimonadaceae bacterium]